VYATNIVTLRGASVTPGASLMAEQGTGHPSQIKNAIEKSADDLGQPGTDPFYGRGRINVAKAFGM